MNGFSLLLCWTLFAQLTAPLGAQFNEPAIDAADGKNYGWQINKWGELEYLIQISPNQLRDMQNPSSRSDLDSRIPRELVGRVKRVVVSIGTETLPRTPLSEIERLPPVAANLPADRLRTLEGGNIVNVNNTTTSDNGFQSYNQAPAPLGAQVNSANAGSAPLGSAFMDSARGGQGQQAATNNSLYDRFAGSGQAISNRLNNAGGTSTNGRPGSLASTNWQSTPAGSNLYPNNSVNAPYPNNGTNNGAYGNNGYGNNSYSANGVNSTYGGSGLASNTGYDRFADNRFASGQGGYNNQAYDNSNFANSGYNSTGNSGYGQNGIGQSNLSQQGYASSNGYGQNGYAQNGNFSNQNFGPLRNEVYGGGLNNNGSRWGSSVNELNGPYANGVNQNRNLAGFGDSYGQFGTPLLDSRRPATGFADYQGLGQASGYLASTASGRSDLPSTSTGANSNFASHRVVPGYSSDILGQPNYLAASNENSYFFYVFFILSIAINLWMVHLLRSLYLRYRNLLSSLRNQASVVD